MKNKLLLSFCLATVLLSSIACGDTGAQKSADTTAPVTEAATETETEAVDLFAGLPDADYDGYEFRMMARDNDRWADDIYIAEMTGDIVDDAVFQRNTMVSEKYNVQITFSRSSDYNMETDAKKGILAGDDEYDLVMAHGRAAFIYANEHLAMDWNELPGINLDAAYWDQDARKSLSINNLLYVMIGDISYQSMGAADVMLFNKQLFNDLDLEYPYQSVKDGTWTYEKWSGMVRDASVDLDGDGVMTQENDRYGYVTQKWVGPLQAFITSGSHILEKDDKDIPYIAMYSERTMEAYDQYWDLIAGGNAFVDTNDVSYSADFINIFEEGRALFIDVNMENILTMRGMTADFGIIPWPKYDESTPYCTNVDAGTNMAIVPITIKDSTRTSVIIEALCKVGSETVIPAYYDVALQTKASRDDESADMLDIIRSARVFDLGYYNDTASGVFTNNFETFFDQYKANSKKQDFTSWYEKKVKSVQKALDKVIAAYTES